MSDTDNDKPKLGMRAPLGLKRTVETGQVKQSFSHGRSNTVIVETKKRRVLGRSGEAPAAPEQSVQAPVAAPTPTPAPAPRPAPSNETPQERQARMLREAEDQRMHALEDARRREEAARAQALEDERQRAAEKAAAAAAAAAAPPASRLSSC